jgi:hypothetical protein
MMPLTAQDKEKILSFLESRLEPKVYDTWCRSLELEPAGDNSYRVPDRESVLPRLAREAPPQAAGGRVLQPVRPDADLVFKVHASTGLLRAAGAPRRRGPPPPAAVEPAP